jgi:hypothetical protein
LDTAPEKPLKLISSIGVNAAYLRPGEQCVSLHHTICALVVLANHSESVVLHLVMPDHRLIDTLCDIRDALGENVTAKLYQIDANDSGFKDILTQVVPAEDIEVHDGFGSYCIDANGEVTCLGKDEDNTYRQFEAQHSLPNQSLIAMHKAQPIATVLTPTHFFHLMHNTDVQLCYADMPPFLTQQYKHFCAQTGDRLLRISDVKTWNAEAAALTPSSHINDAKIASTNEQSRAPGSG